MIQHILSQVLIRNAPEIDDIAVIANADSLFLVSVFANALNAVVQVGADLRQPALSVTFFHRVFAHLDGGAQQNRSP